jgi:hypothetical protein
MLLTLIAGWLQRRLSASVRRRRCPLTWLKSLARDDLGLPQTGPCGPSSGCTRWSPLTSTHQHISMWTCTGHASRPDRIGIRLTSAPDHLTCVAAIRCCVSAQTVMRASTDSSPGTALGLPGSPNTGHKLGWFDVWRSRHYVCWRDGWWCSAARCWRWCSQRPAIASRPCRDANARWSCGDPLDRLRPCSTARRAQVGEEASDCRGDRSDRRTSGSS